MGDFVKGPVHEMDYHESIKQGIRLHRAVDVFTDNHALFKQSKSRISSARRRYAGIIIDLAYDHFLSVHWSVFSSDPRQTFISDFYLALAKNSSWLPERCEAIAQPMISGDWIGNYAQLAGISASLNGISRRIKRQFNRDNPLFNAVDEIESNYQSIEADFLAFFPLLSEHAKKVA
ncbi:DUF479 domain-containing protein [Aliikangiella marina]|uniref:DUF479 domain-containing protein n=1 Tax=Aliikangiella marina TaxID=1712262 RepID=A0A545T7E8_9GAMM|nr:ACP phosphodiesterase [Aliikangiella marina]TQV73153.1 DUF479 domain-containing protein [Aliikangiella marina]